MNALNQNHEVCASNYCKLPVLSAEEIDEVSGAVGVPGAIVGAVLGGTAYAIDAGFSGGSWTGFGVAIGMGALSGAIGGSVPVVRAVWGFNGTIFGTTTSAILKKKGA